MGTMLRLTSTSTSGCYYRALDFCLIESSKILSTNSTYDNCGIQIAMRRHVLGIGGGIAITFESHELKPTHLIPHRNAGSTKGPSLKVTEKETFSVGISS